MSQNAGTFFLSLRLMSTNLCFLIFFFLKKNRVTAVDGKYQIGVYTLRPIAEGEEITFDYNSVTEVSTFLVPL